MKASPAMPSDVVGRVALIKAGSSVNVADIKGSQFRSPYVLVRGSAKSSSYQPALLWSYRMAVGRL
jgi:hypothetical protein